MKTTSLEISKELWERKVDIPSYWTWRWNEYEPSNKKARLHHWKGESIALNEGSRCISAPMLHELLEIMPDGYISKETNKKLLTEYWWGMYGVINSKDKLVLDNLEDTNPADAVAKCLIYLIDNGYCKVVDGKITTGKQDD